MTDVLHGVEMLKRNWGLEIFLLMRDLPTLVTALAKYKVVKATARRQLSIVLTDDGAIKFVLALPEMKQRVHQ